MTIISWAMVTEVARQPQHCQRDWAHNLWRDYELSVIIVNESNRVVIARVDDKIIEIEIGRLDISLN
jgi:hypothetical protein